MRGNGWWIGYWRYQDGEPMTECRSAEEREGYVDARQQAGWDEMQRDIVQTQKEMVQP